MVSIPLAEAYRELVSVMGQLLLGVGMVALSSLWALGIVQMRRTGDESRYIFPGFAMQLHLMLLFSFVAGWVVVVGALVRL